MGGAASHHEHELVLDVLRMSEPAFAVNSVHQIVAWNDGAERLLGLRAEQVIGMRCYEALSTHDGSLCVDCRYRCPPGGSGGATGARRSRRDLTVVSSPQSEQRNVLVTTLAAYTRAGQLRMVHLLHEPNDDQREPREGGAPAQGMFPQAAIAAGTRTALEPFDTSAAPEQATAPLRSGAQSAAPGESSGRLRRPTSLTQRELEVLRLLGAGHSTDDIARELSITRVTARNHVNKVLDKLGVNSRLQAVVIASQLRLI